MTRRGTDNIASKVWLIRAGRLGEDEEVALGEGLALIGFRDVSDLMGFRSVEEVIASIRQADPTGRERRAENRGRQAWAFREGVQPGDIVVLPFKTRPGQIALGRASGPYQYRDLGGEKRHTHPVRWVRPDVARTIFQQDLLYSFGAFMTVCRITRNDAEQRVAAVVEGRPDPGYVEAPTPLLGATDELELPTRLNIAQAAHDEITAFVRSRFPGHDLARLVEALLQAEGFLTHRSPPGPDGGADILAGQGALGLDPPSLCVQVKATEAPADVTIFRALQGTMTSFAASQGLLVCWGGFKQAVKNEARQHTFRIRLWDQSDLVQAIYRTYDRLPDDIQAELPLKRVWALVREDAEDET